MTRLELGCRGKSLGEEIQVIDYDAAAERPAGREPQPLGMLGDDELEFELTVARLHPDRRERLELVVRELLNRRRGYGRARVKSES